MVAIAVATTAERAVGSPNRGYCDVEQVTQEKDRSEKPLVIIEYSDYESGPLVALFTAVFNPIAARAQYSRLGSADKRASQ